MAYENDTIKRFKAAISYYSDPQPRQPSNLWRKIHATLESRMTNLVPEVPTISTPPARAPSPISSLRSIVTNFPFRSQPQTPSPPPNPQDSSRLTASMPVSASTENTSLCDAICTECNRWTMTRLLKDPDEDQDRQFFLNHNQVDSYKS